MTGHKYIFSQLILEKTSEFYRLILQPDEKKCVLSGASKKKPTGSFVRSGVDTLRRKEQKAMDLVSGKSQYISIEPDIDESWYTAAKKKKKKKKR